MLSFLDDFESHPTYYLRMKQDVQLENNQTIQPWIYFLIDFKKYLLEYPMIDDYSSYGPHGLRYVERSERNEIVNESNSVLHEVKNIL